MTSKHTTFSDQEPEVELTSIDPWEIIDQLPAKIYLKDLQSRFVYMNRACAEAMGLKDRTQAYGLRDSDFFTPEQADEWLQDERQIIRTGERKLDIKEYETWQDRRRTWVLTSKLPLRDLNGKIVGTFGMSKDITESENLEQVYLHLLDSIPSLIWVKDQNLRFTFVNQPVAKLFGRPKEEIRGKTDGELNPIVEEVRHFQDDDAEVLRTGAPKHIAEERLTDAKGNVHILETVKVPLAHIDGSGPERLQVLGIAQDITDRVDAEKLRHHRQMAKTIAHSLRTWMTVLDGSCVALAQKFGKQPALVRMQKAIAFVNHAAHVATNLYALEGAEELEELSINETVQSVVHVVNDPRVRLTLDRRDARIRGARFHVENAILELLSNAAQFAPPREQGGLIEVWIESMSQTCYVHVRDNGTGVPDSLRDHMFELFTTSDGSRTGMGLAYVKHVAEHHKGRVRETGDRIGAHFIIEFPAQEQKT